MKKTRIFLIALMSSVALSFAQQPEAAPVLQKDSTALHHGISLVVNRYKERRYGDLDAESKWGGGFGVYYFYRHFFNPYLAFQGRAGAVYRYDRWTENDEYEFVALESGNTYELEYSQNLKYHDFALDIPVSGKAGVHVRPNTFIFGSITLGVTKPFFEMVDVDNELGFAKTSEELQEQLLLLSRAGKNPFPMTESHRVDEFYFMDDWEFNSWIGVGIDSKWVSFEFQVYAFGGTTEDNHRFCNLGQCSGINWRTFLDFSIR